MLAGGLHMARSLQLSRANSLNAERESKFPQACALRRTLLGVSERRVSGVQRNDTTGGSVAQRGSLSCLRRKNAGSMPKNV